MLVPVQLPPGIERDNTPYDTPGRWWDTNLVRWQSGSLIPIKGNERATKDPLIGAVRKIYVYRANDNTRISLVGTDTNLYLDQGSYVDITPVSILTPNYYGRGIYGKGAYSSHAFKPLSTVGVSGGYSTFEYGKYGFGNARPFPSASYSPYSFWTFTNWGEDVIFTTNADGRLWYITTATPTNPAAIISTAPNGNNSVIVTDERHVMAIGQTGGGGTYRRVAWSSREDYTDWNYSSTTNTAGFVDLATKTPLQKGVKVKEGVLIFSMTDIYLASYVGSPYIYSFQRLSDTEMFHPDGIATFNGKAVWLSRTGFQIYNGGFVQPLDCPILNDIFAEMDPIYGPIRIHAAHNGVYPEIWFFYPTAGNSEANRYVIWNYQENWWAWGMMPRSAMSPADTFKYPYMGTADGNVYQHETGYTDAGVSRVGKIWAETGALGVGNGDKLLEIRQVLPATGTGAHSLQMQFFTRQTPEGAEQTFGPYTPRADGYTDVRVTGREARIRFTAAQDGPFGIGKMRFDATQGSGR
jgi:hypothetical protein